MMNTTRKELFRAFYLSEWPAWRVLFYAAIAGIALYASWYAGRGLALFILGF